jgi:TPR repeat protein
VGLSGEPRFLRHLYLDRSTMMSKVRVLFFAADPMSADGGVQRLLLDEDVRQTREKVRAAAHARVLEFDWRPAARTQDLQQALEDTQPQVVHFSGHAGRHGLVLAGPDGRGSRGVDTEVLRELFRMYLGDIRLVVLSACHSRPQAEAIAEVVGCAVGTRDRISDEAAITFNAKFYSAIARGQSVKGAFERARLALALDHFEERDCPELLVRPGVDPAKLVLVSRFRRFAHLGAAAVAALVLSSVAMAAITDPSPPAPVVPAPVRGFALDDCTSSGAAPPPASRLYAPAPESAQPGSPSTAAADLERAKTLCRVGRYDSAFALFRRASDAGSPEAMAFLGIAYLSGDGAVPHRELGKHWLQRAARKHDPRGMNALGVLYENDAGMAQRYRWARHWYQAAAEAGFVDAMRNLGRLYRTGAGGRRSDSLALVWYRKAADAGSADAMVEIGRMHEEGLNGHREPREALRRFRAAAEAGSPAGMYALGRMYQEGVAVPRDYAQARTWYSRGACAGSAEAMNNLAVLYQRGLGVAPDPDAAGRWFRRAADAGSAIAAENLARLNADRRSTVVKARIWLERPEPDAPPGCASYATARASSRRQ